MRVLVTGGAGFIGSHLCEVLLKEGNSVVIVDNLLTGSLSNIQHLLKKKGFYIVIDTILNEELMNELIRDCDLVFHLAAAVGVKFVLKDPITSIEINVIGTSIVLRLCAKWGKRVFIASSSEVYGKGNERILHEEADRILGPTTITRWGYACSKSLDEFLALGYVQKEGLEVVVGRLFNVIGPRQIGDYGMVVPRFVRQALSGSPITVYGTGQQVRTFIYVEDTVRYILGLMNSRDAIGEVFNIGGSEPITIKDLARMVKELTKTPSKLVYIPYEAAYGPGFEEMDYRIPDTSKIQRLTGFTPKYKLSDALWKIIRYNMLQMEGTLPYKTNLLDGLEERLTTATT
jgi:UDP-glucose 4-epimerase